MISFGKKKYIPALKTMWQLCFPEDSSEFINFYFEKICKDNETLLYLIDDKPVASLQIIPHNLQIDGNIVRAAYLSGVMTHPDFRRRGLMNKLLNTSFEMIYARGFDYVFLLPQEKWLIEFYKKFGFEPVANATIPEISNNQEWTLQDLFPDNVSFEREGMIKRLQHKK